MFFEYSRMTFSHFDQLVQLTKPHLTKKSQRALVPQEKLGIALRYLVTGNCISSIAFSFRVGQSTVRNIIKEVCYVLSNVLSPLYLTVPTQEEWKLIVDGFWDRWQMPNCFGAIDGKHIRIKCPPNSGSCYFNYKKYFSIVLLAICDHLYRFQLVDIGAYGGNSDGGIFDASIIGQSIKNDQLNLPKYNAKLPGTDISLPGFFIGDAAFPLTRRMMKPYSTSNLTIAQRIFNYRHSRARRTIETAFGILANRWQIFHKSICMLPKTADKVTLASVCLHNYLMYEEQKDGAKAYSREIDGTDTCWSPVMVEGEQANTQRDILCDYFVSPVGEVNFQYDYITRGTYGE
ncbi:uncharacterized protein LOC143905974 isoform X2 [Temnothorax americanus]|uniref:uncharacterized protein LOC143905974 isoform X2 n=1 Tax=Temnothorax americanus TaxID=1964332 RepID=UPI004068A9EE